MKKIIIIEDDTILNKTLAYNLVSDLRRDFAASYPHLIIFSYSLYRRFTQTF